MRASKDKTISIRLSQAMLETLDARAILDEKDRTQVIREAIAYYLELPEDSAGEKMNSLEQAIEELYRENERQKKKTDGLEKRMDELSRLINLVVTRLG